MGYFEQSYFNIGNLTQQKPKSLFIVHTHFPKLNSSTEALIWTVATVL